MQENLFISCICKIPQLSCIRSCNVSACGAYSARATQMSMHSQLAKEQKQPKTLFTPDEEISRTPQFTAQS